MSTEFQIGETVEIYNSISGWNGQECVISGSLQRRGFTNMASGETSYGLRYEIEVDGRCYVCGPDKLRRKRPKQDWTRLCALNRAGRPA